MPDLPRPGLPPGPYVGRHSGQRSGPPAAVPGGLPAGYRGRPVTGGDVGAVHALVAVCERALYGHVATGADDIAAELARPGLDPTRDTLLVRDAAGAPAGWGWVHGGARSVVDVHPGHRGRGLGSALLSWAEARARASGGTRLVQSLPDADTAGARLLRSRGYAPFVTEWLLQIALPTEPEVPRAPAGVTVRPFRPGDERAAHRLTEDAFGAWQKRRKPYAEWARLTVDRTDFAPALSTVAFAGGRMVGAVLALDVPGSGEGFIDRVAVRQDHRGRGLARVLLRESFRAIHRRGGRGCVLWTHSAAGALPLYERLGMTVRRSATVHGVDLGAGARGSAVAPQRPGPPQPPDDGPQLGTAGG
ncbi:GNAT family N-acetyltransferase [Streptomyces sp. NPDC057382]|uniref:GNAT family N-acetyltransferase n=1 Tax=unclassified Streptomyces TaxID=2593676 RepID=UPI0036256863